MGATRVPQQKTYQSNAQRQAAYRQRTTKARAAQLAVRGLPELPAIPSIPAEKRWKAGLRQSSHLLENICQEMHTYYNERSPEWQESERAADFEERMQAVEEVAESISELLV